MIEVDIWNWEKLSAQERAFGANNYGLCRTSSHAPIATANLSYNIYLRRQCGYTLLQMDDHERPEARVLNARAMATQKFCKTFARHVGEDWEPVDDVPAVESAVRLVRQAAYEFVIRGVEGEVIDQSTGIKVLFEHHHPDGLFFSAFVASLGGVQKPPKVYAGNVAGNQQKIVDMLHEIIDIADMIGASEDSNT
jgi:hypothetical protein